MMRFALLESGSKGNCFVLRDENTTLVIDCGGGKRYLQNALADLGVSTADIDALLITHDHSDHIAQLNLFSGIPVYSPVDLPGTAAKEVIPDMPFQIEHLSITPLALSHDAGDTVGYVIESWQEKLVYITDTGYVRDSVLPFLKGADYIILESNHDTEMLMKTSRPMFLKMRIAGDSGHLCNEDCASILKRIVTNNTKCVVLAHISEQANTRERALAVSKDVLEHMSVRGLVLAAAAQNEVFKGGDWPDEKVDVGSCGCVIGMEYMADRRL